MSVYIIALLVPALWAATNHFDKYIVSKYFHSTSVGAMLIFSSLVGLFVLPISFAIQTDALMIDKRSALVMVVNSWLYLIAILPYLKALKISDTSAAVPVFQLIPVISFVLAWPLLDERLTTNQLVGGILVLIGAIVVVIEMHDQQKLKLRLDTFGLMFLSSFIFALNFLVFKMFALDTEFWTAVFWESIGFVLFALILLILVAPYRRDFFEVFKNDGGRVASLNVINEVINIVAKLLFNYASLFMAITITWIFVGFQPVFVLLYSVLLSKFFPEINKEKVLGKHLVPKLIAVLVMTIGIVIISLK